MNLTNVHIVTGENISTNCIPSTSEYPFATNLSLLFSTFPSNPNFFMNVHLHLMDFYPSGNGTKSHVSLFISETISSSISNI
jgi:hypothetical protein